MLLVNKYCPASIDEILGNREIVSILASIREDFPHLLLTGPPGTGKTTLAHILKKDFDTLELNASDDRGIDIMRVKIKGFCMKKGENKLVILDECDSLTAAAQQALRRLMETTSAKFILVCNQISELIEPVQSRCAVLRFSRISPEEFRERVAAICAAEGIRLTSSGMAALEVLSAGDMRACLNCMQALIGLGRPVDDDFLYRLNGVPNRSSLERVFKALRSKDVGACIAEFEPVWSQKYEAADLMNGFFSIAKAFDSYEALRVIGKYHLRVSEGMASKLQFYAMFNELINTPF